MNEDLKLKGTDDGFSRNSFMFFNHVCLTIASYVISMCSDVEEIPEGCEETVGDLGELMEGSAAAYKLLWGKCERLAGSVEDDQSIVKGGLLGEIIKFII